MKTILSLDLFHPNLIDNNHPINQFKVGWWLGLPHTSGGKYFYDLCELNTGEILNISTEDYGWKPITRPGGLYGVRLNGNGNYINIPDAQSLQFNTQNFTISGWFLLETLNNTNSNGFQTVISRYEPANYKGYQIDINTSGAIYFKVSLNSVTSATFSSSNGQIAANTWYHFMAIRNGLSFYLYLNGRSVATGTSDDFWDLSSSEQSTLIGNLITNGGENQYLQGYIDDISIYNSALGLVYPFRNYNESRSGYSFALNRYMISDAFELPKPWIYFSLMQNNYGVTL